MYADHEDIQQLANYLYTEWDKKERKTNHERIRFVQCLIFAKAARVDLSHIGVFQAWFKIPLNSSSVALPEHSTWPRIEVFASAKKLGSEHTTALKFVRKLKENSTQGAVYVTAICVQGATNVAICKIDKIPKSCVEKWLVSKRVPSFIPGKTETHMMIGAGYMDALCSELFSTDIASGLTPHFPMLYGTGLANVSRKAKTKGAPSAIIVMEYLPRNMLDSLSEIREVSVWYAAFMQVMCGLQYAGFKYGFVHNDLHCMNVMARYVKCAVLKYKSTNGKVLHVPTNGYQYVIIDYGRSRLRLADPDNNVAVASSVFGTGDLAGMIPDNKAADVARLALSLEDVARKELAPHHRREFVKFLKECCFPQDNSENIIESIRRVEKISFSSSGEIGCLIETYTRLKCQRSTPDWVIRRLAQYFTITEHTCEQTMCECYELCTEL